MAVVITAVMTMSVTWVGSETYTIPADKIDNQKIYWGSAATFQKPGKVDYQKIIKSTPEYSSIRKNKLEAGSAKYWILLSKASDRAVRSIGEIGKEKQYDLIAAGNFLGKLEPPIPAEDVTDLVLRKISDEA
jgi:hypothetical protein